MVYYHTPYVLRYGGAEKITILVNKVYIRVYPRDQS